MMDKHMKKEAMKLFNSEFVSKQKVFVDSFKLNFDDNNNPSSFNMKMVIKDIPLSKIKEWQKKLGEILIEVEDEK